MQVQALSHVVLKVQDLKRSEGFYADVLGMRVVSRIQDPVGAENAIRPRDLDERIEAAGTFERRFGCVYAACHCR
jgi:catechol 2,3-dioxygenase-like lactoylglutathione lyase family enzyme